MSLTSDVPGEVPSRGHGSRPATPHALKQTRPSSTAKSSGTPQYESGQSRIGKPLIDAPELYIENSPLFHLRNVHTPLFIMNNDADDAVPWYQGIEFFIGMRRLGGRQGTIPRSCAAPAARSRAGSQPSPVSAKVGLPPPPATRDNGGLGRRGAGL